MYRKRRPGACRRLEASREHILSGGGPFTGVLTWYCPGPAIRCALHYPFRDGGSGSDAEADRKYGDSCRAQGRNGAAVGSGGQGRIESKSRNKCKSKIDRTGAYATTPFDERLPALKYLPTLVQYLIPVQPRHPQLRGGRNYRGAAHGMLNLRRTGGVVVDIS